MISQKQAAFLLVALFIASYPSNYYMMKNEMGVYDNSPPVYAEDAIAHVENESDMDDVIFTDESERKLLAQLPDPSAFGISPRNIRNIVTQMYENDRALAAAVPPPIIVPTPTPLHTGPQGGYRTVALVVSPISAPFNGVHAAVEASCGMDLPVNAVTAQNPLPVISVLLFIVLLATLCVMISSVCGEGND